MKSRFRRDPVPVVLALALVLSAELCRGEEEEKKLTFPAVIIEGEELMRIHPGERIAREHGYGSKMLLPARLRREKQGRYFFIETGAGSEETVLFGWMGGLRHGQFGLDVEMDYTSTDGWRKDKSSLFGQKTSLRFDAGEGALLRVDLEIALREFDLPGPDHLAFPGRDRSSAVRAVGASFSGELASDTSLDVQMKAEEVVIDDSNDGSDAYTRTGLGVQFRRGTVGFGGSFWQHDLNDVYEAMEMRGYVSVSDIKVFERLTVDASVHLQDYSDNGALIYPAVTISADLPAGITWETTASSHMTVKNVDELYGANNYSKIPRVEMKPERNWRIETSLSRVIAGLLKIKIYGFREDWKDPTVWDMVQENVSGRGLYSLRQIAGYEVSGGGFRAELEIGERFRIFLDTVARDYEKDRAVIGELPLLPKIEGRLGAEFRAGKLSLAAEAAFRGEQYYDMELRDLMEETFGLGGRLEYATGRLTVFLEGKNLVSEDYLVVQGYPSAQASWILGARLFF